MVLKKIQYRITRKCFMGVEYLLQLLPDSFNVGEVLSIFFNDVFRLV